MGWGWGRGRHEPNLRVNVDHGGEQKRERFSGACRGDAHHVPPEQGHRPALALDGGGLVEALLHDLPQDVLGHGRLFEGHGRLGNALSLNHDLAAFAPCVCVIFRSLGHVRVFDVEVLRGGVRRGKRGWSEVGADKWSVENVVKSLLAQSPFLVNPKVALE